MRHVSRHLIAATCAACGLLAAAASAQGTPYWSDRFARDDELTPNGAKAACLYDDGSGSQLYVGGSFSSAGGVAANRIARYDGHRWQPLLGGTNQVVEALVVFDDDGPGPRSPGLYAAGAFTLVNGQPANRIARWDGTTWTTLGTGIAGLPVTSVETLAVYDEDGAGPGLPALFAGGNFVEAGGLTVKKIARWNGSFWSSPGGGPDGSNAIQALSVFDDDGAGPHPEVLVAGGTFLAVEGQTAQRIAKWDGASWSGFGAGFDQGSVLSLAVFDSGAGSNLYAGGTFTSAEAVTCYGTARWSGTAWLPMGSSTLHSGAVHALTVWNDGSGSALFCGGGGGNCGLTTYCGRATKWTGTDWAPIPGGPVGGDVQALVVWNDGNGENLWAAGDGLDTPSTDLLAWNGTRWERPGNSVDARVFSAATFDFGTGPELVVGGELLEAGPLSVGRIARWNGSSWNALGGGFDQTVYALAGFDPDAGGPAPAYLVAGGQFDFADGLPAGRLARWNGSSWAPLTAGSGASGRVSDLAVFDEDGPGGFAPALFATGVFTNIDGAPTLHVGRFNGSAWSPLGAGLAGGSGAALLVLDEDGTGPGGECLFACGTFSTAGGVSAPRVARWNGSSWSAVGTPSSSVRPNSFAVFDEDADGPDPARLFMGGELLVPTGSAVQRWDGSSWSAVGPAFDDNVSALAVFDDGSGPALYAGGEFTTIGGFPIANLARWDGAVWTGVGSASSRVIELHVHDDGSDPALFGTGPALIVGHGLAYPFLAEWVGSTSFPSGVTSFADAVLAYDPAFGGGSVPVAPFNDPAAALAAPDSTGTASSSTCSLGHGGRLALAFTDNRLANSGTSSADLIVFSAGDPVERAFVRARASSALTLERLAAHSITPDGEGYVALGTTNGASSGIDLDALFPGAATGELHFDAVHLRDDPSGGPTGGPSVGADIDAVGASMSVTPYADLAVKAIVSSGPDQTLLTVTISFTVQNQGDLATSSIWQDEIYRSTDDILLNGNDTLLGTYGAPGVLAPGASMTRSLTMTWPPAPGTYYLIARTDRNDIEEEGLLDANNVSVIPFVVSDAPRPDLMSQVITAPSGSVLSGSALSVTWRVTNTGTAATDSPSWSDALFLTTSNPYASVPPDAVELGAFFHPLALDVGASYDNTRTVALPHDVQGSTFYLCARADSGNAMVELVEANNFAYSAPFTIDLEPQPDLVVQDVSVGQAPPITLFAGQNVTVTWTDRNAGTGLTDVDAWSDSVWLSANSDPASVAGDLLLGTQSGTVGVLSGGQEAPRSLVVTLPVDVAGDPRWIKVQADSFSQVSEVGLEANNIGVIGDSIRVVSSSTPDLRPTAIGPADGASWITGQTRSVSWSVEDDAFADWDLAFAWHDQVYLSADTTLDIGTDALLRDLQQSASFNGSTWDGVDYTKTTTVTVPVTASAGNWHLIVVVDANGEVYELDGETDNQLVSAPLTISVQSPDLVLTPIAPPASGAAGQPLALEWQVANAGLVATPGASWVDAVYLSADDVFSPGTDVLVRSLAHSGALPPAASYTASTIGTIPVVTPRGWYLICRADIWDAVWEGGSGANNTVAVPFTVTTQAADLVASTISAPALVQAGQSVALSWTVANDGSLQTVRTTWMDRLYLSQDSIVDGGDILLGVRMHFGRLQAGQSYTDAATYEVPPTISGLWYAIVVTDSALQEQETDETNNAKATRLRIAVSAAQPANLVVDSVAAPASGVSGQPLALSWIVRNAGSGATDEPQWDDALYLSADSFLDTAADRYLGAADDTGFLDAGESRTLNATPTIPLGISGSYYVIVKADSGSLVYESGAENDNTRASGAPLSITLPPPCDLAITDVQVPASAVLGTQIAVTWTTENQSGGTVSGTWRDIFYLSLDGTLDPGDVLLGDVPNTSGALLVGGSHVQTANFTVRGALPGNYRVIAIADGPGNIPEIDETDNQVASGASVAIDCLEILPGEQSTLPLVNGQSRYWRITAAADLTLRVRLTHQTASAWTELYLRENAIPAPGIADVIFDDPGASAQALLFPLTHGQSIYVLARATTGVGGRNQDATLAVEVVPFQAFAIAPDHAGTGVVTFDVSGSNLNTLVQVQLDRAGPLPGAPLFPSEIHVVDASRALAAFDLTGQATGSYDLVLTSSTAGAFTLPAAVTVEPATPATIRVTFELSPSIRLGARGVAQATITNAGNVNATGALLVLGRMAGDDVALSVPSLGLDDLAEQGALESLVLSADDLGPGQSEQVELDVDIGAGYTAERLTLGLSGRPLSALDVQTFVLDAVGEALRVSVLADPTSNAALLARAASASAWRSAIETNLSADTTDLHLPGAGLQSSGTLVAEIAVAAGAGLAPVDQVPPTAVDAVTNSLACLSFFGTAFDCLALAPEASGLEQAQAEVTVLAGAEPQAVAVACATPFSVDPNEKSGPTGTGTTHMVSGLRSMEYRIYFENMATASAPAGLVIIEDELEPALHLSSFRPRRIAFGDIVIELPENAITYQNTFDISATNGVLLQVTAGIDAAARLAFWNLQSLDPSNGLPVADGLRGFLPPNDENGVGSGYVDFSILPDPSTSLVITGTGVRNNARIQFDAAPALSTNTFENTFDAESPSSSITVTPGVSPGLSYVLSWSGNDPVGGAGVATYTIWAARDDEPYVPLLADTTDTAMTFSAVPASTYRFYSVAKDLTGNEELPPTIPDTTVDVPPDCNENGIADPVDVSTGLSLDCDGDLQPDECQSDADADGTIDACDGCPADPLKLAPGVCGCGVPDTDSDRDGTADCNDGCPADPLKTAPGICGCGVPDTDGDGDGTADCNDGCPADPLKTAPGICGCGVPDDDTDSDGIADCLDNCDGVANPGQSDCNGDGIGDACDLAGGAPDVNHDGVPDDCQDGPFQAFCFGDGSGTACPCANHSLVGNEEGCLNSLGTGGKLVAAGLASLSNDALDLFGARMPNSSALYFQGTTQQAAGLGAVFGDGLRCAGGSVTRLKTVVNAGGASQFPQVGDPSVSVNGLVTSPGTRTYQVWYRNAAEFCSASTFNLTNGVLVVWAL